ncbi:DUF6776 family protein [Coralloluteibacterium stylophorae]|uniref:DUF6776 family protein n=1 Tax=Coralloluteibacterium stylophorae TaxID=1776034 RepID=UPI001FE50435|nr:DUF6776 family protein [Coralloluteibacterium stylophorae]
MSAPAPDSHRRFRVVQVRPHVRLLAIVAAVVWLASIVGAWSWATRRAAPELSQARVEGERAGEEAEARQAVIEELRQRVATLRRSDEISRSANLELQETLARRDEEIAALRADVAFYERLVGGTGRREGLSVHAVTVVPDADGSWRYAATLTQNLNRGAVTRGGLRLQVEGTRDGKLATLAWSDLLQDPQAAPQPFAFRYFQQLEGSFLLPEGFTPRRVVVRLQADGAGSVERAFPWEEATQTEGDQDDVRRQQAQ